MAGDDLAVPEGVPRNNWLLVILSELLQQDVSDKALMPVRADEAHNPRGYRTITPEGDFGAPVMNRNGQPAKVAWGSLPEIAKAITSLRSGGDLNIISPAMGGANKVR